MSNLNFNKVIIGGRLTAVPELKTTTSGKMVISFSIAVNRKYSANNQQETDFLDAVAWNKTAEFISRYFTKGSNILVTGALQKRMWTDNQNNKRFAVEIIAEEAYFVDSKSDSTSDRAEPENYQIGNVEMETISADENLPF